MILYKENSSKQFSRVFKKSGQLSETLFVNKCLNQIKFPVSLQMCKFCSDLQFNELKHQYVRL